LEFFFLDGFDELLRVSQAEINNYVVKNFPNYKKKVYRDYRISIRVILTSRLTVMQDVDIPNSTSILRLDSLMKKGKLFGAVNGMNFK